MEANRARAIRQTVHAMIFGEAPQRHSETVRAIRISASVRALLS